MPGVLRIILATTVMRAMVSMLLIAFHARCNLNTLNETEKNGLSGGGGSSFFMFQQEVMFPWAKPRDFT